MSNSGIAPIGNWGYLSLETYFALNSKVKLSMYIQILSDKKHTKIDLVLLSTPTKTWLLSHYNNYLSAQNYCEKILMKFSRDKVAIPLSQDLIDMLISSSSLAASSTIN